MLLLYPNPSRLWQVVHVTAPYSSYSVRGSVYSLTLLPPHCVVWPKKLLGAAPAAVIFGGLCSCYVYCTDGMFVLCRMETLEIKAWPCTCMLACLCSVSIAYVCEHHCMEHALFLCITWELCENYHTYSEHLLREHLHLYMYKYLFLCTLHYAPQKFCNWHNKAS